MIIHGNEENFEELLNEDLVLVDFFATWCGPCKMLSPILEEVAPETNIKVVKIDVDECETLARKFGIMSVPTMMLFKKDEVLAKTTGFLPKNALISWIEENK